MKDIRINTSPSDPDERYSHLRNKFIFPDKETNKNMSQGFQNY